MRMTCLSGYKWYRKWKGGHWFLLRPDYKYGIYGTDWLSDRLPLSNEVIIKEEKY